MEVKKSRSWTNILVPGMRDDKRKRKGKWIDEMTGEAQKYANNGNMNGVYYITNLLCNERKNKQGELLSKEAEIRPKWKEHFSDVLKRPDPPHPPEILENHLELEINTGRV